MLGAPGLRGVRPKISAQPLQTILPPHLWEMVENDSFWLDPKANIFGIEVI